MGKVNRKYKQAKPVKPLKRDENGFTQLQFNVPKGVEDDKKVKPKQVFEGFKDKKKNTKSKSKKG